jgi:hypothetical protein
MRVRLSPAVHGHIAHRVRAGPAAGTTPSFPVALVIRGSPAGLLAGGMIIDGARPGPRTARRIRRRARLFPRDRISRHASNAAAAPRSAVMITASPGLVPVALVRSAAPGPRGASASRRAAVPARTFDGPAVDPGWTWHRCWREPDIEATVHYGQKACDPENPAPGLSSRRRSLCLEREPGSLNRLAA